MQTTAPTVYRRFAKASLKRAIYCNVSLLLYGSLQEQFRATLQRKSVCFDWSRKYYDLCKANSIMKSTSQRMPVLVVADERLLLLDVIVRR